MANSQYEYVKSYEIKDNILKNVFFVIRIDGNGFSKFTNHYEFAKPNDIQGLYLMNAAATEVMRQFPEIFIAYGQSDEFSFVFRKDSCTFNRRSSKIISLVVSIFSSNYVAQWPKFFPEHNLTLLPFFDGRAIIYPSKKNIRDYLSWRQVDCHINNLYNTSFWTLVNKGEMTHIEAEKRLCGTDSGDKNELLFSTFHINYNDIDQIFRKGSVLVRKKKKIVVSHQDIIKDDFWFEHHLPPTQRK